MVRPTASLSRSALNAVPGFPLSLECSGNQLAISLRDAR